MTPTQGHRKNTPAEDANSAPRIGLDLVETLLKYLGNPPSADADRDWRSAADALESSEAELRALIEDPPDLPTGGPVPRSLVDTLRRADTRVREVVLLASHLDGLGIHNQLNLFTERWQGAAAGVEPYDN